MDIQLRSETTGIQTVESFEEATILADKDSSIWKISFTLPCGYRIRLIRGSDPEQGMWILEDII